MLRTKDRLIFPSIHSTSSARLPLHTLCLQHPRFPSMIHVEEVTNLWPIIQTQLIKVVERRTSPDLNHHHFRTVICLLFFFLGGGAVFDLISVIIYPSPLVSNLRVSPNRIPLVHWFLAIYPNSKSRSDCKHKLLEETNKKANDKTYLNTWVLYVFHHMKPEHISVIISPTATNPQEQ